MEVAERLLHRLVRGTDVEYAPDSARPTAALQPDVEDAHWSH
ncbi:hypothetical protein [Streptomyces kaniharaensis]|nr:hypothetical protein [Streptomyces kaniharaensis]